MPFESFMSKSSSSDARSNMQRHSRPLFHAMLNEQLAQIGLEVEYDMQVMGYFEDLTTARAGVVMEDGSKHEVDLVVAADGARGNSWPLVAGEPVPARSSGEAVFRVAYSMELALADPMIAERFPMRDDGYSVMEMWVPSGMQVFFWRNELKMDWAITHSDTGGATDSWGNKADPEDALKFTSTIEGFPEVATRVIKATPPNHLIDWKLMWRDPQPTSTSPAGFVVQIGDAAHTLLPSSGNGGTQAIEDALSIAACISKTGGDKTQIPIATKIHSTLRFERVSCLQAFGVMNRDRRMVNKNKDVGKSEKPFIHLGKWITEHDPERYAVENYERVLECLKSGKEWENTNIPPGMKYKPWTIDGLMEAHERGEETVLSGDWS